MKVIKSVLMDLIVLSLRTLIREIAHDVTWLMPITQVGFKSTFFLCHWLIRGKGPRTRPTCTISFNYMQFSAKSLTKQGNIPVGCVVPVFLALVVGGGEGGGIQYGWAGPLPPTARARKTGTTHPLSLHADPLDAYHLVMWPVMHAWKPNLWMMVIWPVMHTWKLTPSAPMDRMTDTCKSTTLSQTSFTGDKNRFSAPSLKVRSPLV